MFHLKIFSMILHYISIVDFEFLYQGIQGKLLCCHWPSVQQEHTNTSLHPMSSLSSLEKNISSLQFSCFCHGLYGSGICKFSHDHRSLKISWQILVIYLHVVVILCIDGNLLTFGVNSSRVQTRLSKNWFNSDFSSPFTHMSEQYHCWWFTIIMPNDILGGN